MSDQERIDELEVQVLSWRRLAWLLVKAAGGKIAVTSDVLQEFDASRAMLHSECFPADRSYIYEAK